MKHPMDLRDINRFLAAQNCTLSADTYEKMRSYLDLIHHWSERQNLVSRHDLPLLAERHLLPSLFLNTSLPETLTGALMDLGSGAGFPGVPLAIMRPGLQVALLDASRKKTLFLKEVCLQLSLNCHVIYMRCEDYAQIADKKYRIIVARAVARTDRLLEWTGPLQEKGDLLYAMKGGDARAAAGEKALSGESTTILRPGSAWIQLSDFMKNKYILRVER